MFVHENGQAGKPVALFLHGVGADGSTWRKHMQQLTEFHCIAPDLPGFGNSSSQPWRSLDETTDLLVALIREQAPAGKAHVVGLSLGGSLAIKLLSRAPERVDRAIIDGAGVLPLPGLPFVAAGIRLLQPFLHRQFVIRVIARSIGIGDEDYPGFRQSMQALDPASFTRAFIQATRLRQPQGLGQIDRPVLFIAGEMESQAVRRSNALLAGVMPNATNRLAAGMGHGWLAKAPELHLHMVSAWLKDEPLPDELVIPTADDSAIGPVSG